MPRDLGIANRLRAAGLTVVEVAGWQTRGSDSFNPKGSVDHHTAGSSNGNCPSLGICTGGRAGLPGPLCNVLIARDGVCYVIASGRANHAGAGGWRGLSGNTQMYGIERENVGTGKEPWTPEQSRVAIVAHTALMRGVKNADGNNVCEHKEWAPKRKVDAAGVDGKVMRQFVVAGLKDAPAPPVTTPPVVPPAPPVADANADTIAFLKWLGMATAAAKQNVYKRGDNNVGVSVLQIWLNSKGASLKVDGDFGVGTEMVVKFVQGANGLKVDGVVGPATWTAITK